jgi:hypothetical protein
MRSATRAESTGRDQTSTQIDSTSCGRFPTIVIEIEFVSADGSNHQSASTELRHASQRKSRPSGAGPANRTSPPDQLPISE